MNKKFSLFILAFLCLQFSFSQETKLSVEKIMQVSSWMGTFPSDAGNSARAQGQPWGSSIYNNENFVYDLQEGTVEKLTNDEYKRTWSCLTVLSWRKGVKSLY